MAKRPRRGMAVLFTSIVALSVAVGAAIASTSSQANLGSRRLSVVRGYGQEDRKVLGTTLSSHVDVPGISTSIVIPSGQTGLILARFSATTICNFGAAGARCEARLVVVKPGGVEETIGFAALDTDDTGDNYSEAHMFEATGGPYGAGTYTVKLQHRIQLQNTRLEMRSWHLAAEYWRST